MRSFRWAPISLFLLPLLLLAACGGDDDEGAARTNISQIDSAIDLVEASDLDGLRDLAQFVSLPCTDEPGAGSRPRCQGEQDGTTMDVFQANECETGWVRRGDLDPLLDMLVAMEPRVYAAFESPDAFYLEGAYGVIFEGDDTRVDEQGLKRYVAIGLEGDNGLMTGIAFSCGVDEPVHFLLPHQDPPFEDYLIEPRG